MKPHTVRSTPGKYLVLSVTVATLVVASFTLTGTHSGLARAGIGSIAYEADMGRYPKRGSVYQSTGGTTYPGTFDTEMLSMDLRGTLPPNNVLLPVPGAKATVDSFFDIFTELRVQGESVTPDVFFDIILNVENTGRGVLNERATGTWDTEILSMDLRGTHSTLGEVQLRESPTLDSVGQHVITDLGGDRFSIDSFFDVWTELSIDGGANWLPADNAFRLDITALVPEPASATLALMSCALLLVTRRRRKSA